MTLDTGMTMGEALKSVAEARPQQEALICEGYRATYGELVDQVDLFARELFARGIRKGDHIAVMVPPGPEFVRSFFSLALLGAVIVPLDPEIRRRRFRQVLDDAGLAALIAGESQALAVLLDGERTPHLIGVSREGGTCSIVGDGSSLDKGPPESTLGSQVTPDDLLAILYTSGTTGRPKGTMHSHRSLIAPVAATAKLRELWDRPNLEVLGQQIKALARYRGRLLRAMGGPMTFLSTTGWHTITGLEIMLQSLLMGDRLVVMPRFHPREALELIERERVTIVVGVPTAYQVLLRLEGREGYDTSSLIICGVGAAPCPPHLAEEIEKAFGCATYIGFGATETGGGIAVSSLADDDRQRTETVGRPLSEIDIKVVDPEGRELPPGEVGELLCRSEGVMKGYYGDPDQTAEVLDEEGWYHTGDLAVIDGKGYIRIVGRLKDLIIRGGQNIYPAEIEAYLTDHPGIREAAVVGVPAEMGGENVWAYLILEEGESMTSQEVLSYCREGLEPYMIPAQVRVVEEYPRSRSGKPQKHKLREQALAE